MTAGYRVIDWNRYKFGYDLWLVLGVALFIAGFAGVSVFWPAPGSSFHPVQIAMRACGAAAFAMLTLVLAIGPLARLTPYVLPLLYNRRHFGVATFLTALVHAALVLVWYYGFSPTPAPIALLIARPPAAALTAIPFELFGLAALAVLFVMAATSHDYWLKALGPGRWKGLHMAVYLAYGLLVAHIAFGALQAERSDLYPNLLLAAAAAVACLHLFTGMREYRWDSNAERVELSPEGEWLDAGPALDIPEGRAVIIAPMHGERIAVFRHQGRVFAVSNLCPHQNGPLGEGRIIDGCITCPWHGWQFRPETGRSPPPHDDKIRTFRVKVEAGHALVRCRPMPKGTAFPGALIEAAAP